MKYKISLFNSFLWIHYVILELLLCSATLKFRVKSKSKPWDSFRWCWCCSWEVFCNYLLSSAILKFSSHLYISIVQFFYLFFCQRLKLKQQRFNCTIPTRTIIFHLALFICDFPTHFQLPLYIFFWNFHILF